MDKSKKPAHNRTVNVRRLMAARLRSARSVATLAPTPHSATFLQPWSLLRKALFSGCQNIANLERYATLG